MLQATLGQLAAGASLSMAEMTDAIDAIMQGACSPRQIAVFLTALAAKGETIEELAGAATAMRKHMTPIRSRHAVLVDTCGPGGSGSRTFNISTAAALVTAAAGVPVAKHGNRGVTSRSGSADALAALGVNIEADLACVTDCLETLGICFCFAPLWHPSMKRVSEVRKQLGTRTIFNLLGPLTNPAGAPFQLLGVGQPELAHKLAAALALLGTRRAVIVSGDGGLGEVALSGPTQVIEASGKSLRELSWTPEDFGADIARAEIGRIEVDSPSQSAAIIRQVLAGESGPARDIVVVNAAAALWTVGQSTSLALCAKLAADAIDSGAAQGLLAKLVERTTRR